MNQEANIISSILLILITQLMETLLGVKCNQNFETRLGNLNLLKLLKSNFSEK